MTTRRLDCVVDASVGIKVCITEPHSDVADALLALAVASPPSELHVPDLFFVECTNILWKHVQRAGHPRDRAILDVAELLGLLLRRTPTADLIVDALPIALDYSITAYDATYVALSRRLGVPLVTGDDALVRKLAGAPFQVVRLADLTLPPPPP
jgi:predicted nucleic acid-binding protein